MPCGVQHWIVFQLLHALAQCHERGICHGDIKCENVLVTSWDWVYLADFASYKPVRLLADNPVSLHSLLLLAVLKLLACDVQNCAIVPPTYQSGCKQTTFQVLTRHHLHILLPVAAVECIQCI